VVLQSRSGTSWTTVATSTQDATGTARFQRVAGSAGTLTLRATAQTYRGAAASSTPTGTVSVLTAGDVTPPAAPAAPSVVHDAGRVQVTWDDVPDADLAGYRVHRALGRDGPWVQVSGDLVQLPRFLDTGVATPELQWYTVTSVDDSGNESGRAPPVRATAGDLTAPAPPTGLTPTPGDGQVELSWNPGSETDLAGYQVYRSDDAAGPWVASGGRVTATSSTVTGLSNDVASYFTVTSVDVAGNESTRAAPVEATPRGPTPTPSPGPPPPPVIDVDLGWTAAPPTLPGGGSLDPRDFGAAGDGTTDDAAALQAAVDHAAAVGAGVELAPDTTYRVESPLLLPSNTYLHGAGSSSVLAFTWTVNDDEHGGLYLGNRNQLTGNHDITLDSFAILGAGTGEPAGPKSMQLHPNVPGIRFRLVDRFQISRLEISHAPGISLLTQGCSNGTIHDNLVHRSGRDGINTGWFRRGGHHVLVANNLVTKVGDDGIALLGANGDEPFTDVWTHHVAAVGNTVQGWASNVNGLVIGRGIAVLGVQDSLVVDNTVDMTHSHGILVGPAVDRANNVAYRSADIRFIDNVLVNPGQLYPGSDPSIDEPDHVAVFANRSDRITFVATTVTNPYGDVMRFDRCSCTWS
jgi:hypothetical protein